jgi:hypothetical protein
LVSIQKQCAPRSHARSAAEIALPGARDSAQHDSTHEPVQPAVLAPGWPTTTRGALPRTWCLDRDGRREAVRSNNSLIFAPPPPPLVQSCARHILHSMHQGGFRRASHSTHGSAPGSLFHRPSRIDIGRPRPF